VLTGVVGFVGYEDLDTGWWCWLCECDGPEGTVHASAAWTPSPRTTVVAKNANDSLNVVLCTNNMRNFSIVLPFG
jgi:hypothetical protein